MRIIFCDSVIDHSEIDPDYFGEKKAAHSVGFDSSVISYEKLVQGNISGALQEIKQQDSKEIGIYRGWMLTPTQYQQLYDGLRSKNIFLINSPEEYKHCHYLPESYYKIQSLTPKSNWTIELDQESINSLLLDFGDSPIIVKDYVKSEKHNWESACYIPSASDIDAANTVVKNFLELRGESLNQGIVFRKFEELEFLTQHSKSGMPLTKEFRIFFIDRKLMAVFDYWEEGDYGDTKPSLDSFIEVAQNIKSSFFTMDIAKKKDGDWIIMELGDGQVAGIPENVDEVAFYQSLKRTHYNNG